MDNQRPKLLLVGLAAIVALALGAFWLKYRSEPRYEGRGIYYWAMRMRDPQLSGAQQSEAQEAVHRLCPQCTPVLLTWLHEKEPSYTDPGYVRMINKLLSWQRSIAVTARVSYRPSRPSLAFQILQDIGPAAKTAVPGLIELLQQPELEPAGRACMLLAKIGPSCIPDVRPLLSSTNELTRALGAATFGAMGPEAKTVAPILEPMLKEKSNVVRLAVASALVKIGTEPQSVIPVLLECWERPDFEGRASALDSLAELKDRARTAVPQLTNFLAKATDPSDRQALIGTLQAIDPQTASRFLPARTPESTSELPAQVDKLIDPTR
jgi:hypothetical protein